MLLTLLPVGSALPSASTVGNSPSHPLLPTKDADRARLACVQVLHAWRRLVRHSDLCLVDSQVVHTLVHHVLKDSTAPLSIVVAACCSLTEVLPVEQRVREDAVIEILRLVAVDTYCLMTEVSFYDPLFRATVLCLLTRLVPTMAVMLANEKVQVVERALLNAANFFFKKYDVVQRRKDEKQLLLRTELSCPVRKAFGDLLYAFAVTDPSYDWLRTGNLIADKPITLDIISQLARDRNHSVRLHMCKLVGDLFRRLPVPFARGFFDTVSLCDAGLMSAIDCRTGSLSHRKPRLCPSDDI